MPEGMLPEERDRLTRIETLLETFVDECRCRFSEIEAQQREHQTFIADLKAKIAIVSGAFGLFGVCLGFFAEYFVNNFWKVG